jgi:hypothetical protein
LDAQIVLALDLQRLRSQPIWQVLHAALAKSLHPAAGSFSTSDGFDPMKEVHRLLVALPGERQKDNRFCVIADVNPSSEVRVATWVREQAKTVRATFRPARQPGRLIVGNGAWDAPMASLAQSPRLSQSAADNPEMRRLCARAGQDHPVWFAAIVPASIRRKLIQDARFPDVASIMRMSGFFDVNGGLHAEMIAELSSTADALDLTHRLGVYLNQAKQHPEMLVRGLAPYCEGVRLSAHDASVHATLDLSHDQLGEFIERIEALAHGHGTK